MLVLALFLAYLPAFQAPFLWDDEVMVVGNPLIKSISHLPRIFTSSAFGHSASGSDFFRPVQSISYILDYHLFGLNPSGFHLMSWLYFVLTCMILWAFLRCLSVEKNLAFACTLLFSVHPLNIETVTYVSGRGDVLFLLFGALALWATASLITRSRPLFLSLFLILIVWISTCLAILSKENAIALPFVLGMLWLILPKSVKQWQYWIATIPILIGNLAYIGYRMTLLGSPGESPLSAIATASFGERLLTLPYILWTYFRLMFIPYPLHMEYLHVVTSVFNPYLWIGMPMLACVLYIAYRSVGWRYSVFCLGWISVGLGPVIQIIPLTATVREHWFSFPLIAALLLLTKSLDSQKKPVFFQTNPWKWGILLATVSLLIGLTHMRNWDWTDPMRLYSHDLLYEPRSFLLHNNIGVLHYRNQDFKAAKYAFQMAVLVTPGPLGYGTALNNLGVISENEGDLQSALAYYAKSIEASRYELAYVNTLRLLIQQNAFQQANTLVNDALTHYPYHPDLLRYGAFVKGALGDPSGKDQLERQFQLLYP